MKVHSHPPFAKYLGRDEVVARAEQMKHSDRDTVVAGNAIDPPASAAELFLAGAHRYEGENLDEILTSSEAQNARAQRMRYISLGVGGLGFVASLAGMFYAAGGVIHFGTQTLWGLGVFGVSQFVARKAVNYSNGLEAKIAAHERFQSSLESLVHFVADERSRTHQQAVEEIESMARAQLEEGGIEVAQEAVRVGGVWVPRKRVT